MSDAAKTDWGSDEDLKRKVLENLDTLDHSGRLAVLNLSEELSSRVGSSAERGRNTRAALLEYAGAISREDLDLMSEAIEEGCGQVDEEGW